MDKSPIIVNLSGAPGAGKSTGAAYIFSKLKMHGINAELITEFAKDKTWESNMTALNNQIYILGKQYYRITRCREQVEVIVTDSPIILSLLYGDKTPYHNELDDLILKLWELDNNILYFVKRVKPYNPKGRNQTEEESDELSLRLFELLAKYDTIDLKIIRGCEEDYNKVVEDVLKMLEARE